MLSEEVLGEINLLFHDMSQPLNYLQVVVELGEIEDGIYGEELVNFKAAVDELANKFRQAKNLVQNSLYNEAAYPR